MTRVELRKIDQTFGERRVLSEFDLSVESGQYVVMLGPSGCGKTTILRIIAGLHRPDRGDVLFDEKPVNAIAPRHRDVALMFQHDGLYPHLTVDQSIRFALRGRAEPAEIESRVAEAIALTRINAIADRYPGRLSGGELRRAALAKTIARQSSVRLLDEPLSALDMPVRHELQDDILRWHAAVPGTTIHVTHDGQEAMRMADKVAVIEQGRVVQFAEPMEILSSPRTVSVAKAMGTPPINLLGARIRNGKVEANDPRVACRIEIKSTEPDRDAVIGIRPDSFDSVEPADDENARDENVRDENVRDENVHWAHNGITVTAMLIRARPAQHHVDAEAMLGDTTIHAVVPSEKFQSAESIRLRVSPEHVHLFEAATGLRIESDDGV